MSKANRREFLGQLGSAAVFIPGLRSVRARVDSEPSLAPASSQAQASASYDLLIAGGRVIDPSQKLSAERDVAISNGKVALVAANIPRAQARQVFEARGKIVTAGLINIHSHVYLYGLNSAADPDRIGLPMGVTTIVDAGSTGAETFRGFRKYVIERSAPKIYALLNIATFGLGNFLPASELYVDQRLNDPKVATRIIEANRDCILGVKARPNGGRKDLAWDVEAMKKAREAADATGVPIMMHWSNEPDLLAILKKGDILAHPYNQPGGGQNLFGGDSAKVLPQILGLKDRGIWTEGQAAAVHHQWEVSEKAASQGWFPDAISTDMGKTPDTPYGGDLPDAMSRFLYLGLSLEQVVERVTTNPAKMLNYPEKVGTLEAGAMADVAIFDVLQGNFEFLDGRRQNPPRVGHQKVVAVATVKSGKLVTAAAGWLAAS